MNSDSLLQELDQETLDFEELLYEMGQLLIFAENDIQATCTE